MKPKEKNRKKKPYSAPRLLNYGDFRVLTRVKGGSSPDGGQKPKTKLSGGNA